MLLPHPMYSTALWAPTPIQSQTGLARPPLVMNRQVNHQVNREVNLPAYTGVCGPKARVGGDIRMCGVSAWSELQKCA